MFFSRATPKLGPKLTDTKSTDLKLTNSNYKTDTPNTQSLNKNQNKIRILHQNAQVASNKSDELHLLGEELAPEFFVVTENGYNKNTIDFCKLQNYKLADYFCREKHKGGGVAIFAKPGINCTKLTNLTPQINVEKNFESVGIKTQSSIGNFTIFGIYRSPNGNIDVFFF